MATKTAKVDQKFEVRVRFNWGYHDAAQCVREGWDLTGQCFGSALGGCKNAEGVVTDESVLAQHFDIAYAMGWGFGYRAAKAGQALPTSEVAWEASGLVNPDPVVPTRSVPKAWGRPRK